MGHRFVAIGSCRTLEPSSVNIGQLGPISASLDPMHTQFGERFSGDGEGPRVPPHPFVEWRPDEQALWRGGCTGINGMEKEARSQPKEVGAARDSS
jgi:hypothetical protein